MDAIIMFTFLVLLLSLLQTKLFISNKNRKKNFPPSPPNSLPILGHLHLLKEPLHKSLARLSAEHGPLLLLRFGFRPVLVVSSASLAEECFKTNDVAFADRPQFSFVSANIPFTSYEPQWREMRRIATLEALSSHRLELFADVRAEEVRALVRHLFRNSGRVELRSCLFRLAVNIITRTIAGIRYYEDDGENDKDVYKFKEVNEKINSLSSMANVGEFFPAMIGWIARHGVKRKMTRYHKYRDEIIRSLMEKHKKKRSEEKDNKNGKLKEKIDRTMIDALLSLHENHPNQYTDGFIKALVLSIVTAGTETSSSTIEWSMSLLLNHPEKLEKARQEIDEQVGHDRLLNESDLTKLSYLHCIINETLRLYPAGPLLIPHVARDDFKFGSYDVDQGTILLVNVYEIHRDPSLWMEPNNFFSGKVSKRKSRRGEVNVIWHGEKKVPRRGPCIERDWFSVRNFDSML